MITCLQAALWQKHAFRHRSKRASALTKPSFCLKGECCGCMVCAELSWNGCAAHAASHVRHTKVHATERAGLKSCEHSCPRFLVVKGEWQTS